MLKGQIRTWESCSYMIAVGILMSRQQFFQKIRVSKVPTWFPVNILSPPKYDCPVPVHTTFYTDIQLVFAKVRLFFASVQTGDNSGLACLLGAQTNYITLAKEAQSLLNLEHMRLLHNVQSGCGNICFCFFYCNSWLETLVCTAVSWLKLPY